MFNQRFALPFRRLWMKRARAFLPFCSLTVIALIVNTSCVKLSRHKQAARGLTTTASAPNAPLINLNTATRKELESLPGIGAGIAARIIEHRERYGAFRRVEHLLMVRGISERRFAELRERIAVN